MKKIVTILAGLAVLALLVPAAVSNIVQYPIATDYYYGSDTLHVTTTDTKWGFGSWDVYAIRIINPTAANLISIRVQQGDSVSTIGSYCGAYGTIELFPPLLMGPPIDSLWIDADAAATVYIDFWGVK